MVKCYLPVITLQTFQIFYSISGQPNWVRQTLMKTQNKANNGKPKNQKLVELFQ